MFPEIIERIGGYGQIHFYRREPSQRLFGRVSAALIVGIHIYGIIVFGSTFWIDSSVYVALSEALKSPQGMTEFYQEGGRWMFSHLQPGVSLLWLCLSIFDETWRWPVLAICQHAIAALALWVTFCTVNRYWPTWLHLAPITILVFLPTYQSFHNALLTESLTSSLFLLSFSACLRIAFEYNVRKLDIFTSLLAIFLITQFRSYWGVTISLMLF
nr:NLPE2 [Rhizobium etli]